jgi:hypothetical protein
MHLDANCPGVLPVAGGPPDSGFGFGFGFGSGFGRLSRRRDRDQVRPGNIEWTDYNFLAVPSEPEGALLRMIR